MPMLHLLFSHNLTDDQKRDAIESLGVNKFVSLPEDLQRFWSNIPSDLESLNDYLKPLEAYLKTNVKSGDYVLIQGDFGATYHMVNIAKSLGAIPLYATTERKIVEEIQKDGIVKKTALFAHKKFRRYEE